MIYYRVKGVLTPEGDLTDADKKELGLTKKAEVAATKPAEKKTAKPKDAKASGDK